MRSNKKVFHPSVKCSEKNIDLLQRDKALSSEVATRAASVVLAYRSVDTIVKTPSGVLKLADGLYVHFVSDFFYLFYVKASVMIVVRKSWQTD